MTEFIEGLSRRHKWLILLSTDLILIALAFFFSFALRYGTIIPIEPLKACWPMLPILLVIGGGYAIALGLPKIKLHAFEIEAIKRIALCAFLLAMTAMSLSFVFVFSAPRSVPIIFGILFFVGSVSSRIGGLFFILHLQNMGKTREPVAIYGAGAAGIQLISALRQSSEVNPVLFVDDNIVLQKLNVAGLPVRSPAKLDELVRGGKIKRVLIALPSISKSRQREIIRQLDRLPCEVQLLPSFIELIEGTNLASSLRTVAPEELLGRDKLDLVIPGVLEAYQGRSILISGAGGSIGSELCLQILNFAPSKLVLYEHSELALYSIERDLKPIAEKAGITLEPVLGSVCDAKLVKHTLDKHDVQIVLHAAAYKHVPLVESNELAGLKNNVLGVHIMAKAAENAGIERFVFVSTDKAVRPTNVMGASKRLAELIIQDLAKRSSSTIFSMVRFGNVLGSSGSVIPLFQSQIAMGGPVTLTHEDVTRYFMTISEASRLVIISGSLAEGGDVFVLDMGAAIKIKDLASRMIELSGLSVRNADNLDGDIEIVITGLRPGEKLYEELLIGGETLNTPHPKILRANEVSLSEIEMAKALKDLREAIELNDTDAARDLIVRCVEGYHPPSQQAEA